MTTNTSNNNTQKEQVQEINEQIAKDKLSKVVKLSHRNMTGTIIISFFLPITGYIYTRRWLPFLWFMLGGFLISGVVAASEPEEDKAGELAWTLCAFYGAIVAPIDNGQAIARAREKVSDLSL